MTVTEIIPRLLDLLLPAPCLGCGAPLPAAPGSAWPARVRGARLGLCPACRARLAPPAEPACASCGRSLPGARVDGFRCGRCRARPPAISRLWAAWLYRPPLDEVIRGLKFGRLDYLGRHLGEELAARFAGELAGFDAAVPVPLSWRRQLARGYNQAALIAGPLAASLGIPLLAALRRRATPPQTRLLRQQRLASPGQAFAVRSGKRLQGSRLLLVDDVVTTGATLDAAARALRKAGAREVVAAVAARTPEAGE